MARMNGVSGHAGRIAILLLATAAAGCDRRADAPAAAIAPVAVSVITVARAPLAFDLVMPGRIEPQRTAQSRARDRSEKGREGEGGVRTGRSRGSPHM